MPGKIDIVVPVDPQDLLDDIAFPLDINHIGGSGDLGSSRSPLYEIISEESKYPLYGVMADILADKPLDTVIIKVNDLLLNLLRIEFLHPSHDLASGEFLYEKSGAFASVSGDPRITSPLETERSVCLESMPLGSPADGTRIEIGALDEHAGGGFRHARVYPAENTGYAHRAVLVGDNDILRGKLSFRLVQSDEPLAFHGPSHDNLPAADLISVKSMERLPELPEDEIGHIYHIVDRTQANGKQPLPQPFGRRADLDPLDSDTAIPRSGGRILDIDRNGSPLTLFPILYRGVPE